MDFLKDLFGDGGALTFEQFVSKVTEAKMNIVNIADGSYVSRAKFDDKVNALNQKVTDLQTQVGQRDTDLADLQTKFTAAQADAGKLSEVQTAFANLQTQYAQEKVDWEAKTAKQEYEFRVREKANEIQFTSPAAKRDFISQTLAKELKADGDSLLGYEDFVTKYKADNPGAIVEPPAPGDDGGKPPVNKITFPGKSGAPARKGMSLSEMMAAKNANPNLQFDFEKE